MATFENGLASIIVLTFNKLQFTKNFLKYLYKNTKYLPWELIIIDNGSTDGTPQFLKKFQEKVENCHLILNSDNFGFAKGNNQGIKAASGCYIIFMNNDVFVTPNWLNNLIICLESNHKIGIVGAKLVYPRIRKIQHAGIVFSPNGKPFHIHRYRNTTNKNVNTKRTFNAVTAALMLIKKDLLDELGGFDEAYKIGSYEDVDLCLRARLKDFLILYCPQSEAIHYEFTSSRQFKEFNQIAKANFKIFLEKWGHLLKHYKDPALTIYLKMKYLVIDAVDRIIPSKFLMKLQQTRLYSMFRENISTY